MEVGDMERGREEGMGWEESRFERVWEAFGIYRHIYSVYGNRALDCFHHVGCSLN